MQIDREIVEQALEALTNEKFPFPSLFMDLSEDNLSILAARLKRNKEAVTALREALAKPEPLGPGESWEYDDGFTMNRRVYRHGKLTEVIPIETIQDTPQMRPFKVAHSFGNREHRPTDKQENV
jgi:hypothetical protein